MSLLLLFAGATTDQEPVVFVASHVFEVPAEDRTFVVPAEDRTFVVPDEGAE